MKIYFYFLLIFQDTVGIEWSPNGRILASCSLDGTICFWNPDPNSPQTLLVKIESAHSGFIKGLAWDPSGKFLASQSDDGSCVIWNVESLLNSQVAKGSSFILDSSETEMFKETVLEKIFVNMSKMTFFHRPGWSPDGSLLALANATNRQLPVVALVERNNWQGPGTFLVGHLGPVEAVRFNPRLFKSSINENKEFKEMVCAVAGQDGQVSLWSSSQTTPLLVLQDLFEHSVMDLAWSPDGSILVAVSYDGAAVAIKIKPIELGLIMMSDSEQSEHLKNVFGNRSSSASDSVNGYVESVKVIECLRENEEFLANRPKAPVEDIDKLTVFESSGPVIELSEPFVESKSRTTEIAPEVVASPLTETKNLNPAPTVAVNGKKRITPQLLSSNAGSNSFSNFGNNLVTNSVPLSSQTGTSQQPRVMMSTGVRLKDEDFLIHRKLLEKASGILLSGRSKLNFTEEVFIDDNSDIPGILSVSIVDGSCSSALFSVSVEIINSNPENSNRKSSALIQFIQSSRIVWKERFKGSVYLATGCRKFLAFAIQSSTTANDVGPNTNTNNHKHVLLILTSSGRRYFPPISLDSKAIYLKICSSSFYLSLITQNGSIQIWNLRECKIFFSDSSIGNFINSQLPVNILNFDPKKMELIFANNINSTNNNNKTNVKITFNSSLGTWTSDKNNMLKISSENANVHNNSLLEDSKSRDERIDKLKSSLLSTTSNEQIQISISELEFELSIIFINLRNGKLFETSGEFNHFEKTLAIYALKLGKEGRVLKAQELIEDLKELKLEGLIEKLLKPFFSFSIKNQNLFSSSWQDFLSKNFSF